MLFFWGKRGIPRVGGLGFWVLLVIFRAFCDILCWACLGNVFFLFSRLLFGKSTRCVVCFQHVVSFCFLLYFGLEVCFNDWSLSFVRFISDSKHILDR